ncbi:hypothetical protein [Vibrio vulnificus]|uniref:hypothetical protein n=1 Tax=Vibrio vulnificus TaxID=672 RepID=UPI000504903F|nr:hypothetical protein [Vibrio vulnificus]ASJ38541.1 hypothetical protein VVCECT4999_07510 [Vibrio vulnificus]EGR0354045.1 hypothetical protein [Vibrio vulnificus]EGR0642015.1 hypothetical protein [Vibrio vulnificus]EGR0651231.1 hypothetical protein [Vibrio vulnificus]EHD2253221.1 hypothetical protein [Vibrio vulnificus]
MVVQVLLVLIGLLFVFIVFGIGVIFGGGEQPETSNGINSLIALGTALSACSGLGTLLLLIRFRYDWKHPKIDESQLNLIANLRKWQRFFKLHVDTPQKLVPNPLNYLVLHEVLSKEIRQENDHWQNLESSFDVLLYYVPTLEHLNSNFEDIVKVRYEITELIGKLDAECASAYPTIGTVESLAMSLAFKRGNALTKITTLSDKIVSAL